MCVCVCKEKEAEENGGKSDAVETAASGGTSAVVGEAATGDNATEIVDKSQVVFFSYAALRCSPPLSDSATLRQCNCGVHRHSQNVVVLLLCMPLCGVYRRLACKFSKVGREELGDVTEEEAKNETATDESITDNDVADGLVVCKKCCVRPKDPKTGLEGACN